MRKTWRVGVSIWRWVVVAGMGLLILFLPIPAKATTPVERMFRIQASRFEYSPAILYAEPGDFVTIELAATDVVHGLSIDGYGLETSADPGQTTCLSFVADQRGSFRFHCTVTCGDMHPFMTGKLQVGQNERLWRAAALMTLAMAVVVWRSWK